MIVATMVFVVSLALCLFYLQVACHKILSQEFNPERLRSFANSYRLEFLFVRKEMEQAAAPVDYSWVSMALKCDFLALTYLMKNTPGGCSRKERLLMVYFKTLLMVLSVSHAFKLNERGTVLKQTSILNYFTNVLSERVEQVQFCSLTA